MTAKVGHVSVGCCSLGAPKGFLYCISLSEHCDLLGLGFGPLGVDLDWLLANRGLGLRLGFLTFSLLLLSL